MRDVFGTEFIFKIFVEKLANSGFIFEQPVLYLKKKKTKLMVICTASVSKTCSITAISKCGGGTGQSSEKGLLWCGEHSTWMGGTRSLITDH